MLQALIHGKLSRERANEFFSAEDLLTSVVLGSASYLDPKVALLPFLSQARSPDGEYLPWPLVTQADCEFCPYWPEAAASGADKPDPRGDEVEGGPLGGAVSAVAASQPEVVVRLTDAAGRKYWLLVEVKLHSGISSGATADGAVNHQLAKYWLHLRAQAAAAGAVALGVVYITTGLSCPTDDIQAAQDELQAKAAKRGAFYWVSWRRFESAVANQSVASPLLRDVLRLLREDWNLNHVEVSPTWPRPPQSGPAPKFFRWGWVWPVPQRHAVHPGWFRNVG